jgi:hypothetical protein
VGELSSYKSDLELVSIMLNQKFRLVKKSDILYNLKYIERNINPQFKALVSGILKHKGDSHALLKNTEEVEEILNVEIQAETKRFIASTKKLFSFIKV